MTYPNPSSDIRWLIYDLPAEVVKAELMIHDLMGNLVRSISLSPTGGIGEIPNLGVATGVYIGTLLADGMKIDRPEW